jgi:hypothetical protein
MGDEIGCESVTALIVVGRVEWSLLDMDPVTGISIFVLVRLRPRSEWHWANYA